MFKKLTGKSQNISDKHPSLPVPGSSKEPGAIGSSENDPTEPQVPWRKRFCNYLYDRENNLFCNRSCKSWFYIIIYSIMYLIFLSTYTLIFLFGSLSIIKFLDDFQTIDKVELLTYSNQGIGLSATPTSLNSLPVIWYRNDPEDYAKYVNAVTDVLNKRKKREIKNTTDLGPCGSSPYGYGHSPCIILRINKQLKWSAKPMNADIAKKLNAPKKVQEWMKMEQKLWLHCDGIHSYDKEHLGKITYYPNPPGFDPNLFPLTKDTDSPLIAVQISGFTFGISLALECKLWHSEGVSTIDFILYVTPKKIDHL
ncbi:sodium/potassium-transporting ATPase subunit beta-1-like [Vanessa cardui]|uniref:sodium/potassium-transporting ATPase subunit beta-1-like n=1 Tax=Vanessa cardui TaxID=171605 RepID=UPI001F146EC2|nr:sodium/potassium-transporting ATPase subunit beta-1-like [Vanessa cardui]